MVAEDVEWREAIEHMYSEKQKVVSFELDLFPGKWPVDP